MKILVAVPLPETQMDRLKSVAEVVVADSGFFPTRDDFLGILPDVDAVATTVFCRFDTVAFASAPNLKVISQCGIGLDHINLDTAQDRGISVFNTPGIQDETVAEMAIALIFSTLRKTVTLHQHVTSGAWSSRQGPLGNNIRGKRLGLIGMGGIGQATARKAKALGMTVTYTKPTRDRDMESEGVEYATFSDTLAMSDVISLHLPLTDKTHGMIDARALSMMKKGSVLINTARGAIVDEDALVKALSSGHLAAAGLDVMTEEPLPTNSPLAGLENVVLQPHAGGATHETRAEMEKVCVDNLLVGLNL